MKNQSMWIKSIFILLTTLLISTQSVTASQYIHLTVLSERGENIDKFHYDDEEKIPPNIFKWSEKIFVRQNPDEKYFLPKSILPPLPGEIPPPGPHKRHDYEERKPRILIEIFKVDNSLEASKGKPPIYSNYLDVSSTILIPDPGLYRVRCSTTIQVDGKTQLEYTGVPVVNQGSNTSFPDSVYPEGVDDYGRYEIYKTEIIQAAEYAYKHYKRYTYHTVSTTLTYVSEGENDKAFVCLLTDPDSLGEMASIDGEFHEISNIEDDITNRSTKIAVNIAMDAIFNYAIGSGNPGSELIESFLSSEVANLVYTGTTPEDDFDLNSIVENGAESLIKFGITKGVCFKLGIVGGPYGLAIGLVVSYAPDAYNLIKDSYHFDKIKNNYKIAIIDDLVIQVNSNVETNFVYVANLGEPLKNLRLGTWRTSDTNDYYNTMLDIVAESERLETLTTFVAEVPSSWGDFECREGLGDLHLSPALEFDGQLVFGTILLRDLKVCVKDTSLETANNLERYWEIGVLRQLAEKRKAEYMRLSSLLLQANWQVNLYDEWKNKNLGKAFIADFSKRYTAHLLSKDITEYREINGKNENTDDYKRARYDEHIVAYIQAFLEIDLDAGQSDLYKSFFSSGLNFTIGKNGEGFDDLNTAVSLVVDDYYLSEYNKELVYMETNSRFQKFNYHIFEDELYDNAASVPSSLNFNTIINLIDEEIRLLYDYQINSVNHSMAVSKKCQLIKNYTQQRNFLIEKILSSPIKSQYYNFWNKISDGINFNSVESLQTKSQTKAIGYKGELFFNFDKAILNELLYRLNPSPIQGDSHIINGLISYIEVKDALEMWKNGDITMAELIVLIKSWQGERLPLVNPENEGCICSQL